MSEENIWDYFIASAIRGDTQTVLAQLNASDNVEEQRLYAGNALFYAVWKGYPDMAEAVCAFGVDVEFPCIGNATPLMGAVMHKHRAVVEILLAHGADVHAFNKEYRKSVLDYAMKTKDEAIIKLIKDKMAEEKSADG